MRATMKTDVVVAGHICLDVIPEIRGAPPSFGDLFQAGKLLEVGPACFGVGGAVANTGLALHRLGVKTALMGKVGDDPFGHAILGILRAYGEDVAAGMIVDPSVASSYTIVLNPPGLDRCFLYCPCANDTFGSDDLDYGRLEGARIFHFGYPPLMRRMFRHDGAELVRLLRRARERGPITSLDMALPDPTSEAGRQDWPALLRVALPWVDVFLPSLDEIAYMLRGSLSGIDDETARLRRISDLLLEMGPAVVAIKLGERGLYVRTTADAARFAPVAGRCGLDPAAWRGRERIAPCFEVEVAGATGAGDCAIAGFLAAMVRGMSLADAMTRAVAAGACNVERADSVSGIPAWSALESRLNSGWPRRPAQPRPGWRADESGKFLIGPAETPP